MLWRGPFVLCTYSVWVWDLSEADSQSSVWKWTQTIEEELTRCHYAANAVCIVGKTDSKEPPNAHSYTRENDKLIVVIRLESVLIGRCKIARKANIRE